jgi:hypothetical protein
MSQADLWRPGDDVKPGGNGEKVYQPDVLKTIVEHIDKLDKDLRELSLDISGMTLCINGSSGVT